MRVHEMDGGSDLARHRFMGWVLVGLYPLRNGYRRFFLT